MINHVSCSYHESKTYAWCVQCCSIQSHLEPPIISSPNPKRALTKGFLDTAPWLASCCTFANESVCNSKYGRKCPHRILSNPLVETDTVKSNVNDGACNVVECSEFFSSFDNLKDLFFKFSFEWSTKLIFVIRFGQGSNNSNVLS